MPRTCNAPVPVGAGALLCLRAGEVALGWGAGLVTTDSRGGAGLGYRVVGEAPVTPPVTLPVAVSGEAARVRIMVRYILERHRSERSAGFTCGVGCLPFCWTLDS